jgi:hypothetical protein
VGGSADQRQREEPESEAVAVAPSQVPLAQRQQSDAAAARCEQPCQLAVPGHLEQQDPHAARRDRRDDLAPRALPQLQPDPRAAVRARQAVQAPSARLVGLPHKPGICMIRSFANIYFCVQKV